MELTPAAARLAAALAEYQPGPDLREETIGLAHVRDLLDLTLAKQAAQLAQSELWDDDGYISPVAWLRHQTRMASGVAADRVAVGLNVEAVPQSVAAVEAGEIGFAHLALIARLAESIRPASLDERPLLAKAREQTVTRFRRTCEHARHAQDPAGFAEEEAERHEARFLELSPEDNGSLWLRGWLPPEGGSLLRSALEPLARPGGLGDDRSRSQRLADALIEAVTQQHQTELLVTCSLETLEGRRGALAAETEWGGILSGQAVERLACSAALRRLVLDSDSVAIDLGRKQRLLSPPGRRALDAHDKHCIWPGCDRLPRWCQSHHRQEWSAGGGTAVKTSVLLCGRHHHLRNEGGWQLLLQEDGEWKAIPPIPPTWLDGRSYLGGEPWREITPGSKRSSSYARL